MQFAYPKVRINVSDMAEPREIWQPVIGYEKIYEVSSFGNLRRVNKPPRGLNNGYHSYNLSKNGEVRTHRLHTLVAAAFLGERPEGLVIDHIDGDKLNNNAENLRYVTQSDNLQNRHKDTESS